MSSLFCFTTMLKDDYLIHLNKQRIAIAGTVLEGPRIQILDEASPAMNTELEAPVQEAILVMVIQTIDVRHTAKQKKSFF